MVIDNLTHAGCSGLVVTCPTVAYIKRQITYMNAFFKNVYCKEMLKKLLQNTAAERKLSKSFVSTMSISTLQFL